MTVSGRKIIDDLFDIFTYSEIQYYFGGKSESAIKLKLRYVLSPRPGAIIARKLIKKYLEATK